MRIIVGSDYYDNALAYGRDNSIAFVRARASFLSEAEAKASGIVLRVFSVRVKTKNLKPSWRFGSGEVNRFSYRDDSTFNSVTCFLQPVLVVIGEKVYQGVRATYDFYDKKKDHYFWSIAPLKEWIKSFGKEIDDSPSYRWMDNKATNLEEYFKVRTLSKESLAWMIEHKYSIVTYTQKTNNKDEEWQVNGDNLKDLQFFKVMDAFAIFQELAMWVGGVLPKSGNAMVEITDNNVKISKAGFDKFSFRKQKQS